MIAYACLQHWYMGAMFFAPIPIIGVFVWMSGRRHAGDGDGPDDPRRTSPAGITG